MARKKKTRNKNNPGNTGAIQGNPPSEQAKSDYFPITRRKRSPIIKWAVIILVVLCLGGLGLRGPDILAYFNQPLPLEQIQQRKLIVDVHEHIQSLEEAHIFLDIMDELGIGKMLLMGSSSFTLTLDEKVGFTNYDTNNEELLKIAKAYPGRFEAWPTISPDDPEKLEKFKDLVARGASGLKLYIGHGYLTANQNYMFHTKAMDDPSMIPVYQFCQENFIPICMHVNPFDDGTQRGKPGFADEFIAVLTAFPDLKVIAPHFILSSIHSARLEEFLDCFPNLYTDVSFGDYFMADRFRTISRNHDRFKRLFERYPDRFMFGADLVLTPGPGKTREWVREQMSAYIDMLSKDTYTSGAIRDKNTRQPENLRGLALPDHLLERVLYKNYYDFIDKRPKGTVITRQPSFQRMNVKPVEREPGQAIPPRKP